MALDYASAKVLTQMASERYKLPNNPEQWKIKNFSDAVKHYGEHYEVGFQTFAKETLIFNTRYNKAGESIDIYPSNSLTAEKVFKALRGALRDNINIDDDFLKAFGIINED